MNAITTLVARLNRRKRTGIKRGRVIKREPLAEYGGQGRGIIHVEAVTYSNGTNRIVRRGAP